MTDSTPPEALRLLRLRALLDEVVENLEEAVVESTISDTWAPAVLSSQIEANRARAVVLSSIQALKDPADEVLK